MCEVVVMMGGSADLGMGDEGWAAPIELVGRGVRCAGSEMGSLLLGCSEHHAFKPAITTWLISTVLEASDLLRKLQKGKSANLEQ